MPAAARLGDKAQIQADAHGCPACPHPGVGPIVVGSNNVFTNDRPQGRQDDLGIHAACCNANNFQISKGSGTVYVNGKPMARMQDQTKHCGGSGKIIEGSSDVLVDDNGGQAAGLGSYLMNAVTIRLEQATASAAGQAKKASDTHKGGGGAASSNVARDTAREEKKSGSITAARWSVQRAANGQEVEIQVRVIPPTRNWGEGILRTAGALADDPYWDAIMEEVHKARKTPRRPQVGGE